MRLEHLLAAHAQRTPGKTVLVAGERRLTFAELLQSTEALARGLSRCGVAPGDRVLVYLPNGVEFVQLLLAASAVGAISVPVNMRLTPKELAYFAQDSRPSAIAYHSASRDALAQIDAELGQIKRIVVGDAVPGTIAYDELLEPSAEPLPEAPLSAEDCMILYTSGTTGKPKGALITQANCIVQNGFLNAFDWGITAEDRFLVTTPMAHRTGLGRMINTVCLGATLVLMERFDAERTIELVERERITALGMVTTVARMLLPFLQKDARRCASLRHIIVTGEAFPVELKRQVFELLPHVRLCSYFAMTEVGSVTSLSHEEQFTHPASVGRPTPGIQVKLVDDSNRPVPVGEAGEMLVRSGIPGRFTTMRGYYNRPEETASTIVDGWVRTGDMARMDADGYLYIVDRKKDMVLSGGYNVYTKEVEQVLIELPAVADAAVIGVPDAIYGEAVTAFVELHPGQKLTAEALIEHSKSRIASYKKPKHVYFVDALPRNSLGKVLKAELRKLAAAK
ncbi:MAG: AMP-binding protein [Betaproteobacteria bacterium]|nr:AMP-binding protein [Betaproteobacteria bacterium]